MFNLGRKDSYCFKFSLKRNTHWPGDCPGAICVSDRCRAQISLWCHLMIWSIITAILAQVMTQPWLTPSQCPVIANKILVLMHFFGAWRWPHFCAKLLPATWFSRLNSIQLRKARVRMLVVSFICALVACTLLNRVLMFLYLICRSTTLKAAILSLQISRSHLPKFWATPESRSIQRDSVMV